MANVKISQLPSLSTMTDSAIIPVVASSTTQQISGANLKTYFSSVAGNITASYFLGNGSQLTGITATADTGNLDIVGTAISIAAGAAETLIAISPSIEGQAYIQVPDDATANIDNLRIHNDAGNIEFGTNGGTSLMYLNTTGNLTMPNGGYINFVNTGGITQSVNEDLRFTVSDDEEDGWAIQSTVNDGAGNDLTRMQVRYDGIRINTDVPTNNYSWDFRDSGEFDVPKSIRGPVGGNLVISIGDQFGAGPTFIDLQTRSYVGDALISNIRIGDPNVTVSTASGAYNWSFGSTGNLTVPGNIQSISTGFAFSSGIVAINYSTPPVITTADNVFSGSETGQVTISGVNPPVQANGTWYYEVVATNGFALYLDAGLTQPVDPSEWPGYVDGGLAVSPGYSNLAVTGGNVRIVSNYGETWTFEAGGALRIPNDIVSNATIDIDNRASGNTADIRLYAADDIELRGRDKPNDSENEGGDINIYAGIGAASSTGGFDTGGGGDIQIRGGTGGAAEVTATSGSSGGFVTIAGGDGGTSVDSNTGSGGSINITAGSAPGAANTSLGGSGGGINISAGDTTRINENGGSITLNTGSASGDGTGPAGYVEINIPSSNVGPGGTWTFGGTGTTLNVPANAEIYGANFGNFTVGCAGNTIVTSSDYGSNVQNWVFGYTGDLTLPDGGNINTGTANANVALNAFSSAGNTVSIQAQGNTSSAVISIFSNAGPVTSNWTFTTAPLDPTESYLYVPGGASITTPNATGGAGGKNIFIEAGAADQSDFYTGAGGELMLKGGRGAFNDGGGGGPGGNVNINAGESADPAGVAGNVYITAGALKNWVFDNTGNLTVPGSIILPSNAVLTGEFASPAPSINGFHSISAVNFSAVGNISATGNSVALAGTFRNGDGQTSYTKPQITFGYENTTQYPQWIHTRHSAGVTYNNAIDFYTNDGTADAVFTANAILGLTVNQGRVGIANPTPGYALDVTGTGNITGNLSVAGNITGGNLTTSGTLTATNTVLGNTATVTTSNYQIGYRDIPQLTLSANATAALTDAGKHFYSTTAGNLALTLPDNSNVAFATGTALTVVVNAAGNVLVNQGTGVSLYMAGSSTTGNRVVGAYGLASVMKVAANTWVISGTGVY